MLAAEETAHSQPLSLVQLRKLACNLVSQSFSLNQDIGCCIFGSVSQIDGRREDTSELVAQFRVSHGQRGDDLLKF